MLFKAQILKTHKKIRLSTEDANSVAPMVTTELDAVLKSLPIQDYNADRTQTHPYWQCLSQQKIVNSTSELTSMAFRFEHEVHKFGLLTLDLEGNDELPDLILLQALGGPNWIINLYRIQQEFWFD